MGHASTHRGEEIPTKLYVHQFAFGSYNETVSADNLGYMNLVRICALCQSERGKILIAVADFSQQMRNRKTFRHIATVENVPQDTFFICNADMKFMPFS
ncbi:hypothetical protein IT40_21040 [Paracoccus versutus]|nr:hypothetical protein IT40_21040 [Paracoccus versutus]